MAKILVIGGFGEGHINPMIPIIKEWVSNGDNIHFFSTEDARAKVERLGVTFQSFNYFLQGHRQEDVKHFLHFITLLLQSADIIVPRILTYAQGEQFDFVFHDSLFGWGNLISRILGIPHISSHASFAATGKKPKMAGETPFKQITDILKGGKYIPTIKKLAAKVAATYKVPPPSIGEVFSQLGDLNIVYTSEYFQPNSERLNGNYAFVGSSIHARGDVPAFPFETLDNRPIVYISMGTELSKNPSFFQLCIEAFKESDMQVVISAGKHTDLAQFAHAPNHIIVRPYVPQIELLARTSVFVTHGGMNSTSEALYYDVPLVLIPHAADQPIVAARVEELGAGMVLNKDKLTAATLRSTVVNVMQNRKYKTQAEDIGRTLRDAGGYRAALERIDQFRYERGIN